MTENEAINVLKMVEAHGCLVIEAKIMAIKALEEIQQYRAIGTVTEFVGLKTYEMNENVKKLVDTVAKTLVEAFENLNIEEVNMYQIGYNKAIDEFAEVLKERLKGMQMVELQGEDVCPCAETGEECPYINQNIGCQYCAREHTIQEVDEIAEQMKGGAI